jgi:hypothetical protein
MSDQNEDLSPEELDALLRDLQGRAGSGAGTGKGSKVNVDDDGEDLEAFLRSLEEADDEPAPRRTATATASEKDDPFLAQFAALEAADKTSLARQDSREDKAGKPEMPKESIKAPDEKKPEKKPEKKGKAKAEDDKPGRGEVAEPGTSVDKKKKQDEADKGRGLRRALFIGKWLGLVLPVVLFWWVLGSYLGNWVSAGWLISLVSTLFVFSLPALARHWAKRGRYVYWLAGLSALLLIGLVAPIPQQAGSALSQYGHWPASTVAELAGWPADHSLVRAHGAVGQGLGGLLTTGVVDEAPRQLGTALPLSGGLSAPDAPQPPTPALPPDAP